MSFYVNLPSNSSLKYYPDNTLQSYKTKLEMPLKFDCNYEVGLCEILFPKDFEITFGYVYIIKNIPNVEEEYEIEITHQDNKTLEALIKQINLLIEKTIGSNIILFHFSNPLKLKISDDYEIEFCPKLTQILNLNKNRFLANEVINLSVNTNSILSISPTFYIYCDIIEYQFVGDMLAPLLRTCTTNTKSDYYNHIIYDVPHYLKVNKSFVSDINISIYLDTGEKVKFSSGKKVFVKLHFRPSI